jgi:hypothetical protein
MKFITLIPLLLCLSSPAYSKNSPFDRNVENDETASVHKLRFSPPEPSSPSLGSGALQHETAHSCLKTTRLVTSVEALHHNAG